MTNILLIHIIVYIIFSIPPMDTQDSPQARIIHGSPIFLSIGIISLINTCIAYFGMKIVILFWLEITSFLDYLWINEPKQVDESLIVPTSLLLSGLFLCIDYLAKKGYRFVFWFGFVIYALDALVSLSFHDYFWAFAHIVVLKILYDFRHMWKEDYEPINDPEHQDDSLHHSLHQKNTDQDI